MKYISRHNIANLLKKNILFQTNSKYRHISDGLTNTNTLDDEDRLLKIAKSIDVIKVKSNSVFLDQVVMDAFIIIVFKGSICIFMFKENEEEFNIGTVNANSFYYEILESPSKQLKISAKTTTDSLIGLISTKDFWQIFHNQSFIINNILWSINRRLSSTHIDILSELIETKETLIQSKKELENIVNEKTKKLKEKDMEQLSIDKITCLGTMAAGIAHEISNPLGFIKTSMNFCKRHVKELYERKKINKKDLEKLVNVIDRKSGIIDTGVERISKIIGTLQQYIRLDVSDIEIIDINEAIDEVIEMLKLTIGKEVRFIRNRGQLPKIETSSWNINQFLIHIIKNSIESMDETGTVIICTSFVEKYSYIVIQISDFGVGMSSTILDKAFTPFFTTKPVGTALGVGLTITERIIKGLKGTIDILSEEDNGTTVTVKLPVKNMLSHKPVLKIKP
ncbi:integral membrane sensor signal transduction histidine kinase [Candidatus Magnetoovum chiemensis]|nr:integral membrane sensor signal transduction histidine kinase [Candidatus Magnetoovum chiemensis]